MSVIDQTYYETPKEVVYAKNKRRLSLPGPGVMERFPSVDELLGDDGNDYNNCEDYDDAEHRSDTRCSQDSKGPLVNIRGTLMKSNRRSSIHSINSGLLEPSLRIQGKKNQSSYMRGRTGDGDGGEGWEVVEGMVGGWRAGEGEGRERENMGEIKTKGENWWEMVGEGRLCGENGRNGWEVRESTSCPPTHMW